MDALLASCSLPLLLTSRSLPPGVIDFIATSDGHETEPALTGAIAELRTKAAVVKVLGSWAVPQGPAVNVVST